MRLNFFFLSCIFILLITLLSLVKSKPVIGILALPNPQEQTHDYIEDTVGEIYVRWLESFGAEVVVIHPWFTSQKLDAILSQINGVLFQGGHVPLGTTTQYDKTVRDILSKSKEYFSRGDYFPIWGTCLGFESILIVEANSKDILGYFSDSKRSHPSILTEQTEFARMYSLFSEEDIDRLENEDSTHHFHIRGVSKEDFDRYSYLKEHYAITLLANDKEGRTFISSFEGIDIPIYGVQYHPEKTPFNHEENYPLKHTTASIKVSQLLGMFFIAEARRNTHRIDAGRERSRFDFISSMRKGEEFKKVKLNYHFKRRENIIEIDDDYFGFLNF